MFNITDKDFVFLENEKVDFYSIELKTGEWEGVSYIYGKVSITETPELGTATLSFTYTIMDSGKFENDDLIGNPEFKNYIGAVLQHVISDSLKNKKAKIGHIDTNTDTHTKSSD